MLTLRSHGVEEIEEIAPASWYLAEYFFSLIEKLTKDAGSNREPAMARVISSPALLPTSPVA